jgi:hypothetical protein
VEAVREVETQCRDDDQDKEKVVHTGSVPGTRPDVEICDEQSGNLPAACYLVFTLL